MSLIDNSKIFKKISTRRKHQKDLGTWIKNQGSKLENQNFQGLRLEIFQKII